MEFDLALMMVPRYLQYVPFSFVSFVLASSSNFGALMKRKIRSVISLFIVTFLFRFQFFFLYLVYGFLTHRGFRLIGKLIFCLSHLAFSLKSFIYIKKDKKVFHEEQKVLELPN